MGLFLSMSSAIGVDATAMLEAVECVAAQRGATITRTDDLPTQDDACLADGPGGATFVHAGHVLDWDAWSAALSVETGKPVFSFHIHDGDFWMFILFVSGEPVVQFNPVPDYWETLDPADRAAWLPKATDLAPYLPGVDISLLAPYLVEWKLDDEPEKACQDDEFERIDWQVVDFMRRLGLVYPEPDHSQRFIVDAPNAENAIHLNA